MKKNMFLIVGIIVFAVLLLILTIAICFKTSGATEIISYERYIVKEGDNLWMIARNSNGWNTVNTEYIIDAIQEKSNCGSIIYPGQILYIPMYKINN